MIQGYSSSGHSINQGSIQKWTQGTHTPTYDTVGRLQWNDGILIAWIIFLFILRTMLETCDKMLNTSKCLFLRLLVCPFVCLLQWYTYYITTYVMYDDQSCGVSRNLVLHFISLIEYNAKIFIYIAYIFTSLKERVSSDYTCS